MQRQLPLPLHDSVSGGKAAASIPPHGNVHLGSVCSSSCCHRWSSCSHCCSNNSRRKRVAAADCCCSCRQLLQSYSHHFSSCRHCCSSYRLSRKSRSGASNGRRSPPASAESPSLRTGRCSMHACAHTFHPAIHTHAHVGKRDAGVGMRMCVRTCTRACACVRGGVCVGGPRGRERHAASTPVGWERELHTQLALEPCVAHALLLDRLRVPAAAGTALRTVAVVVAIVPAVAIPAAAAAGCASGSGSSSGAAGGLWIGRWQRSLSVAGLWVALGLRAAFQRRHAAMAAASATSRCRTQPHSCNAAGVVAAAAAGCASDGIGACIGTRHDAATAA
eukprot:364710-Chlamydomonas_euryale.AAC.6